MKQQGLAAFQQCRNLAESCFREGTGSGVQKIHFFADYQNFRTVTLIPLALAGIDARAPFFSRRIRWTPPSFPWHITEYLRGLVSVYERPIMAGVRILIVSSIWHPGRCISFNFIPQHSGRSFGLTVVMKRSLSGYSLHFSADAATVLTVYWSSRARLGLVWRSQTQARSARVWSNAYT